MTFHQPSWQLQSGTSFGCAIRSYSSESKSTLYPQSNFQVKPIRDNIEAYMNLIEMNRKYLQDSWPVEEEFRKTEKVDRNGVTSNPEELQLESIRFSNKIGYPLVSRPKYDYSRIRVRVKVGELSPVKKSHSTHHKALSASLRYNLVSIYNMLERREDFMNELKGKKNDSPSLPLKNSELEEKLIKYEEQRGKDKGRVKFNHITNEQLRSIKYKPRQVMIPVRKEEKEKVHYDEEVSEEEESDEERAETIDMATWKKRNGIGYNQKVFIVKGGYHELKKSLIDRGWYENEDVWSPHYDFKWTTRICDINFIGLRHCQGVNHFNNNFHLTSKYGLTRRLRTLAISHNIDADRFYPRCYDLGDQVDFENFVENFKFTFAESVSKRFLIDKNRYKNLEVKIRIISEVLKRRIINFHQLIQNINKGQFPSITPEEWSIITETSERNRRIIQLIF